MIYFIVNPAAGSGRAIEAVPIIEKIMREDGVKYSVIYTTGGNPEDFARVSQLIDFNAAKTIVCVGGDGTVQEYIGLVLYKDIKFGVIPAGSGNDLILSMPGEKHKFEEFEDKIKFYTEKLIRNQTVLADAVSVNGDKYFFNIGGTGIDIEVLKYAIPLKRFLGGTAYFISLIKNAVTYKASKITLTIDEKSETDIFLLLAVCNGAYYGGGMKVGPPAVINDGLITLCKATKMSRLKLMSMFPRVKTGGHSALKEVSFINCSSLKLEFDGTKTINLDGNLIDFESPLTFEIMKNAVKLIV